MLRIVSWISFAMLIASPNIHAAALTNFVVRNIYAASQQAQVTIWDCPSNYIGAQTYLADVSDGGSNLVVFQQLSGSRIGAIVNVTSRHTNSFDLHTNGTAASSNGVYGFIGIRTNSSPTGQWSYEVTNKICGFRVIGTNIAACSNLLMIQGLILRDGSFVDGTNYMYQEQSYAGAISAFTYTFPTQKIHSTNITVTINDSGPLYFSCTVRQTYARDAFDDPFGGVTDQAAGTGYIDTVITFEAFSRTVMLYQETDTQLTFYWDMAGVLTPNRWRYRGGSYFDTLNPEAGFLWGLPTTTGSKTTAGYDTLRDMGTWDIVWSQSSQTSTITNDGTRAYSPPMRLWNNMSAQGTHIWSTVLLTDTNAAATAPVFGAFMGPNGWGEDLNVDSNGLQDTTYCNPYWLTNGQHGGFIVHYRHPDYYTLDAFYLHRLAFGLYIGGTNGMIVNSSNTFYWPDIDQEYHMYSGVPAKSILVAKKADMSILTPKANYGQMFGTQASNLAYQVRAGDTALANLMKANMTEDSIVNVWSDFNTYWTNSITNFFLADTQTDVSSFFQDQWGKGGLYLNWDNTLQGGQQLQRWIQKYDQYLGDPLATSYMRWELRTAVQQMCRMFYDQNWFMYPTNFAKDFSLSGNFQAQAISFQILGASYATNDPALDFTRDSIPGVAYTNLLLATTATTSAGSLDYVGAYQKGLVLADRLMSAKGTNLTLIPTYANRISNAVVNYMLGWNAGYDGRYGRNAFFAHGDSDRNYDDFLITWEPTVRAFDTNLANRMVRNWWRTGRLTSAYDIEALWMDWNAVTNSVSVEANWWGTNYAALFHQNNDTTNELHAFFRSGPRTWSSTGPHDWNDVGASYISSFGAQVATSASSYGQGDLSPGFALLMPVAINGAYVSNNWNSTTTAVNAQQTDWDDYNAINTNILLFGSSGNSDVRMTNSSSRSWYRQFTPIGVSPRFHVFRYEDRFRTNDTNIVTFRLLATNSVVADFGTIIPPVYATALPKAGTNYSFGAGLHTLSVTGVVTTPAIDMTLAINSQSASNNMNVSQYTYSFGGHIDTPMLFHFEVTNTVQTALLVTVPKGNTKPTITTNALGHYAIVLSGEEMHVTPTNYTYTDGSAKMAAATFDGTAHSASNGIVLAGGPIEAVLVNNTNRTISVDGVVGSRFITVPTAATNNSPLLSRSGRKIRVYTDATHAFTLR